MGCPRFSTMRTLLLLSIYFSTAQLWFIFIEDWHPIDIFHYSVETMSTVGSTIRPKLKPITHYFCFPWIMLGILSVFNSFSVFLRYTECKLNAAYNTTKLKLSETS